MLDAVTLQRAQVIAIPQRPEQVFENVPVPVARVGPEVALEMASEIFLDAVVVDQRVIQIDEEDDGAGGFHETSLIAAG